MGIFWIYGIILLGFLVLFLKSRGGFSAAAGYLRQQFFQGKNVSEDVLKKALLVLFGATLLAAGLSLSNIYTDTVREGYLAREGQEGLDYEATLRMETEAGSQRIGVLVEAQSYTLAEARDILKKAEEAAFAGALGGQEERHVSEDLQLPERVEGLPVSVSWVSGDIDVLGWDGKLAANLPPEGVEVELVANLVFDGKVSETANAAPTRAAEASVAPKGTAEANATPEELLSRTASRVLRVFPREAAVGEEDKIRAAIAEANAAESERLILPEEIDGQKVRWVREDGDVGVTVLFLGLVLGLGLILNSFQKAGKAAEERQRQLALDYPYVISRLTLYLGAGLSLRNAFLRMAETYTEALRQGGERREAMEEVRRTATELRNGHPETEAIRRFGERSGNARYRTLAQLLLQHISRGNRELVLLLAEDSREAFEERKKAARIRGEKAGTQLVFPMLLMLGVVIAILMVPAVVNFM